MKLVEIKSANFVPPNFEDEFNEVEYQPEAKNYFKTKERWLEVAKTGKPHTLSKSQLLVLNNHDDDFKNLLGAKQDRVKAIFTLGNVEMPIVLKDDDFLYLLAGNTRLAFARKHGYAPVVWLIDTPDLLEYF